MQLVNVRQHPTVRRAKLVKERGQGVLRRQPPTS